MEKTNFNQQKMEMISDTWRHKSWGCLLELHRTLGAKLQLFFKLVLLELFLIEIIFCLGCKRQDLEESVQKFQI